MSHFCSLACPQLYRRIFSNNVFEKLRLKKTYLTLHQEREMSKQDNIILLQGNVSQQDALLVFTLLNWTERQGYFEMDLIPSWFQRSSRNRAAWRISG